MKSLVRFYQRIDLLQQSRWYKIIVSGLMVVGLIAATIALLNRADEGGAGFLEQRGSVLWSAAFGVLWCLLLVWMGLSLTFVLMAAAMVGVAALLVYMFDASGLALAVIGFATLSFTFMLLIRVVLILFRSPSRVLAVAHTVVKESVRLRLSVSFIVVLLILLPLIPLIVESENALRYRIQSFISYSTGTTFYLAACMTIFLACGPVAFEIRDRQIWQLLTKPVSRVQYLLGNWIGIVAVDLVILIVAGVSIFMFVLYLREQPAANAPDARAVKTEVLVARIAAYPRYQQIDDAILEPEVDRRIENDFELSQAIDRGQRNLPDERRRLARELQDEFFRQQRTIAAGTGHEVTFHGLERARDLQLPMKLRFRVHYGGEDTHETHPITFLFLKNGNFFEPPPPEVFDYFRNPSPALDYVPTMSQSIDLPWELVGDENEFDGQVTIVVINGYIGDGVSMPAGMPFPDPNTPLSLNFDPQDLVILYTVGGFEANYFRALIVYLVKLAFIAMLGLATATVLSFPVACLLSFTIFLAATIGPFLALSLDEFQIREYWRIDRIVIKALAQMMVFLFEPFGEYNPTKQLVDGRLIAWQGVAWACFLLGIVWSGLTLGIGYLAFRDKELATYSGHG